MLDYSTNQLNQLIKRGTYIMGSRKPTEKKEKSFIVEFNGSMIDIRQYPTNKKNNYVIPDEIFDACYRSLPDGTESQSGKFVYNGGILNALGSLDKEKAREIHRKGAEALHAKYQQRESIAQTIDAMLRSKASRAELEKFNLPEGATRQEALVAAMFLTAIESGTVRAADFLRDTVGERPVDKKEIDANIMTDDDKLLIEKVRKRLDEQIRASLEETESKEE